MVSDILRQIPPSIFPLLKMAARLIPGHKAELLTLVNGLTNLESSQILELDNDLDTLVNSLQIRPECYDDVARVVQKHHIQPDDMIGKLLVRILRDDEDESVKELES